MRLKLTKSFKALASLHEFPRIFLKNGNIHQVEPKREIPLCRIRWSRSEKKTASSRNSLKREENHQRTYLVEPKQEILK